MDQQRHLQAAGASVAGMPAATSGPPAAPGLVPSWELPFVPAGGNRFLAAVAGHGQAEQHAGGTSSPQPNPKPASSSTAAGSHLLHTAAASPAAAPPNLAAASKPGAAAATAAVAASRMVVARLAAGVWPASAPGITSAAAVGLAPGPSAGASTAHGERSTS